MKIGIMQPYFFPYLAYWQLIKAVDKYVVYDDVTYIKGGWISRNNILLDGDKYMITLPLDNPSSFRKINEIEVTSNIKQRQKVLRTLEAAYKKAPYYNDVMPWIEELILDSKTIADLNYKAIKKILDYLDIDTEIVISSKLDKNNELKGQDKVIHINKLLGSDTYINAIGGVDLYTDSAFSREGIKLQFLQMGDFSYRQFNNEFVEGLSIIDVLMFNDRDKIEEYLDCYTLLDGKDFT